MPELMVIDHPVVQHKLSQLRMKQTPSFTFRQILTELSMLLGYEATRGLALTSKRIETPLEAMEAPVLAGLEPALISVLRAGNGILDGMLEIMPTAPVGHVGVYRDHETLEPVQYYYKVPPDLPKRDVLVLDPMLATGNSAIAAIDLIKNEGHPKSLRFVCIVAAPEGVANFHAKHPDVPIITAAVDRQLNDIGYILPGLGDAGDRIFGTA